MSLLRRKTALLILAGTLALPVVSAARPAGQAPSDHELHAAIAEPVSAISRRSSATTSTPTGPISIGPRRWASSARPSRSSFSFISSRCRNSVKPRVDMVRSRRRRRTKRGSKNTSIRFRSGIRRSIAARASMISRPLRKGRCTCTTRGARTTAGCARSQRRTASISIARER